ncbi:MAG: selenocysteine-specific translation elongation factor [Myxococcota bacterium]
MTDARVGAHEVARRAGRPATPAATPLVLGTAGHIDHGKTTLVRALTGIDCDRLPEEKARGITIELGFAPLVLPSGLRLSVIDVPGHERLVHTMVSGATGIDLVLFVVAADEGIMPQSREHLAICDLLGIERGVVALSKSDAVEADLLELAQLEVADELEHTCLAGAPIVPVSALSGRGLDELRAALEAVARAAPPRTLRDGPAWLAVDRAFSMRGFGTVVTGTLRGAPLEEGMNLELWPDDGRAASLARIRGLQVHGESVKRALPGSRVAVNLQAVEVEGVPRGSVVATPNRVEPRARVEAELRLLPGAQPLKTGARVALHLGTAERGARVSLLDRAVVAPGDTALVELRLDRPLAAVEGDRFVVRGYRRIKNAGWTWGGGRILDAAPRPGRRKRADRAADLAFAAAGDREAWLAARLARAGWRGQTRDELTRELRSLDGVSGVRVSAEHWLDPGAFAELRGAALRAVRVQHADAPTDAFAGFAQVRARVPTLAGDDALRAALDAEARSSALEATPSGWRVPGHRAHAGDSALATALVGRLAAAGLAPDTLEALARELRTELRELRSVCEHLVRERKLVRVSSELFFDAAAVASLRERVVAYLKANGRIDPTGYKELTGQSRKHTVPLMEYFDAEKLTVRRENVRVLRGA